MSMTSEAGQGRLWSAMEKSQSDRFRVCIGKMGRTHFAAESFRPVLAFGPQRSRKTTGVVVPALLEWDGPAIVTSVREDVIQQTIKQRRTSGCVSIFDPAGILAEWPETVGWNPLELVDTWDDAKRMADFLADAGSSKGHLENADFWHAGAKQLLAPHLFAAAKNNYKMADVVRWIKTQEEYEVRALLVTTDEQLALEAAEAAWEREDRARSSIYTTLQIALDAWDHRHLQQSSAEEPLFHLTDFFDGRANTLYLCAPPDAQEEFAPVVSALIHSMTRMAYERNRHFASHLLGLKGADEALRDSPGTIPLLLLLDEAGNIAPLRNLATLATTAAGTALQLVTVFHDLSQMVGIYGEAQARSIVNNHSALLVLPGNRDPITARLCVDMLGDEKVYGWFDEHPSSSTIRRLSPGTTLCIYENLPPIILQLHSSLTDPELLRLRGEQIDSDKSAV